MRVKLSGFRELEQALAEELPKATAKNVLRRSAIAAMQRIEGRAEQLAPRRKGKLVASVTTKPAKAKRVSRTRFARSSGVEVWTGPIGKNEAGSGNPAWQEFGTVKMPPHPYMRPAADAEGGNVIAEIRQALTEQIAKAKARIAKKAARGK